MNSISGKAVIVFTAAEGSFGKRRVPGVDTMGARATFGFQYDLQPRAICAPNIFVEKVYHVRGDDSTVMN
ncbi:MAG: hypothetical protein A2351_07970 [Omnitrophica bacterium RIFOXYB12_FULL_50_7]|nr:MAG: hypothetical protein A2351_07970 [Omnitrophica bacterium RIFOXYB12_FULL_50_7]